MNEKITENLIRKKIQELNYYDDKNIIIEEQKSENEIINNLLQNASKKGKGIGKPEFIIGKKNSDVLIIIECKANIKNHCSEFKDKPKDYAVDGALHYASFLKNQFHIIAIAFSGESEKNCKLSTYQWIKGEKRYFPKKYNDLISYNDYYNLFYTNENIIISEDDLLLYAKKLHDEMRDEAKLKEAEKPLLVGALLLALDNGDFTNEYPSITNPKKLAKRIIESIEDCLKEANLSNNKIDTLKREFGFIETHTYLTRGKIDINNPSHNNNTLHKFLFDIHKKVYPFIKKTNNIDLIGKFYSEFLRYTGGDGKGLGIVLTPTHITDLFCDLAEINKNSKVIDICSGTGGFLIAAMEHMLNDDPTIKEIDNIYKNNLVGVETQTNMFALSCANMIIRGDGKANINQDNCFEIDENILKNYNCNVGLINPPYAQKKEKESELYFIKKMLDILTIGGIGIAIIPQSCVMISNILNNSIKEEILKNHTLKAVMSMPDQLFDPSNSVTCIVAFEAHKPHNNNKETWFGYWKDDGFKIKRNKGRIDYKGIYKNKIKKDWLDMFFNKKQIPGLSILKTVSYKDEWLAEVYMDTNFYKLHDNDFILTIKNYSTYKFYNQLINIVSNESYNKEKIYLDFSLWKEIKISPDFFKVSGTKTTPKTELQEIGEGNYPYVTTQTLNNGVEGFYDIFTEEGNVLVIDSAVKGFCTYQELNFTASDHVEKLKPNFNFNPYIAMFLSTVINLEQYRYSYGRKFNQIRIKDTKIMLPFKKNIPDWQFMEDYIKSLPYSNNL